MEPEYAALVGTAILMAVVLIVPYKGRRMKAAQVISATISAGGAVTDIIAITAVAGILIGAMNLTGVTFSLTQQLITLSAGNLPVLILLTALASFVLGLPLPTLGVYLILAVLAAPALVQAGISPMQAHLFVLFSGILGMVTPPVALAAFAAATIARADQWRTGWAATRISWCAYIIPFLFIYSPALVMRGDPVSIVAALAVALGGILAGTVAVVGYLTAPVPGSRRAAYAAAAFALLLPANLMPQTMAFTTAAYPFTLGMLINAAGAAAAIALIVIDMSRGRAARLAAP